MKIIKLISFLLILNISLKAQTTTTDYDTCSNLQQYAGEWKYVNGLDTIKVFLKYQRTFNINLDWISDRLWGWHDFKNGNQIIESNYSNRFFTIPYVTDDVTSQQFSIRLRLKNCSNTENSINGFITDYHKGSNMHRIYATLNAAKTQMTWHIEELGGLNKQFFGITLPPDFVLIKQ
jgi:hypothetical protein